MDKSATDASYENIVENLDEGLIYVEPSGVITVFNQQAERITELSRGFVVGKTPSEVFRLDPWITELLKKTLDEGKDFFDYEGTLQRKITGEVTISITTKKVFDKDGSRTGVIALIKDLSLRKSIEAGALRKERLALLGAFAANLAHEIKNPLAGIKGSAQLLARKLSNEGLVEYTAIIEKESDRLNTLVNDMLGFTRPARHIKKELNIHKAIDDVLLLMKKELEDVSLSKEYDPSIPPLKADAFAITQVLLNIIKNAAEAARESNDGKSVKVSTRIPTDFHIVDEASDGAKFIEIEVKDSGKGIAEENLDKIFTPFFSTKSAGSGLGLAISYRIIQEHDGFITIVANPKGGTIVSIYIPLGGKP